MKDVDEYGQHWNAVPNAEYIVDFREGNATVLCAAHMNAMRDTCEAAGITIDIYKLPEDEEPIACQACHLQEVKRPKILLQ
jgi:hypothetical protein